MLMINILSVAIGLFLILFTLFAYETEEKKFSSWIEDAWNFLDDKNISFSQRLFSSLKALIVAVNGLWIKVYGERFFSIRAYISSVCVCAGVGFAATYIITAYRLSDLLLVILSIGFLLLLFVRKGWFFYVAALAMVFISWAITAFLHKDLLSVGEISDLFYYLLIPLFIASVADFLAISITRYILFFSLASNSLFNLTSYLALAISITIELVVSPAFLFFNFSYDLDAKDFYPNIIDTLLFLLLSYGTAIYSIGALLVSLSFFVVLLTSLFFRFFIAILPRAVYVLIKLKILENKKASISAGIFLITMQIPQLTAVLERLSR